jgi:hypothetical protein
VQRVHRVQRAKQVRPSPQPHDADALRLFICNLCQTIEELPTFKGKPDDDVLLHGLLERHGHKTMSMGGERPDAKIGIVWRDDWQDPAYRRSIIEQIRSQEGHTGLGDEFYATRDTYTEEATKCFAKHGRPSLQPGCIDYRSRSKLLGNTLQDDEDLRELTVIQKENLSGTRQKIYLCNFCPYHAMVESAVRERNY